MDDGVAFISRSGNATKLEYRAKGSDIIRLWEQEAKGTVETTFDGEGAVLKRQLLELDKGQLDKRIQQELYSASVYTTEERPYEEVRLKKACPNCGSDALSRCTKSVSGGGMPVMPLYLCSNCNKKSYYLTTAYLEYLVRSNISLFAKEELPELDRNGKEFVKELEEYILRIFASKKIMRIR
jgi:transposase-like protein